MARSRVIVEFPDRPAYAVRIGSGLMGQVGSDLRSICASADQCVVLCDEETKQRCLPTLHESLQASGFRTSDITIPVVEPDDVWACVGELHRAFGQLHLPEGTPLLVCACVQAAEVASFAVALCDAGFKLVLLPASVAAVYRLVGTDTLELDAGHDFPLQAKAALSHAVVDLDALKCESEQERLMGDDELASALAYCDQQFHDWFDQSAADIAAYQEDALVLALAQTLAARADAIGLQLRH